MPSVVNGLFAFKTDFLLAIYGNQSTVVWLSLRVAVDPIWMDA